MQAQVFARQLLLHRATYANAMHGTHENPKAVGWKLIDLFIDLTGVLSRTREDFAYTTAYSIMVVGNRGSAGWVPSATCRLLSDLSRSGRRGSQLDVLQ